MARGPGADDSSPAMKLNCCGKVFKNEQGLMFHQRYKHGRSEAPTQAVKTSSVLTERKDSGRAHNIKDSKLGYMLCVLCGEHGTTEEIEAKKCESLSESLTKIAKEVEKDMKSGKPLSDYAKGNWDWRKTVPEKERKEMGWE